MAKIQSRRRSDGRLSPLARNRRVGVEVGRHEGSRAQDQVECRGNLGLALFHACVALFQQRLGVGVFLLAQECGADQRLRVESRQGVRLLLLQDWQALAQDALGLGPVLSLQEAVAELPQFPGIEQGFRPVFLLHHMPGLRTFKATLRRTGTTSPWPTRPTTSWIWP